MISLTSKLTLIFTLISFSSCYTNTNNNEINVLPKKPNILFIMTDDQGAWTPGYRNFKGAHTPILDTLRTQSVDFTNAMVTTPVCSPSRATLLTGLYACEHGITDYIVNTDSNTLGLNNQLQSWPRLLQQAGYATGLIGKWHLGHNNSQHHPSKYGYDEFMGFLRGGHTPKNPTLEKNGITKKYEGLMCDILTDNAIEFIQKHSEHPFALSVHYRSPHTVYLPVADEDWAPHQNGGHYVPEYPQMDPRIAAKKMAEYCAAVTIVDRNVGRILKELENKKISDKTIVVFTSDHGYNRGHHGVWSKGNSVWMVKKTKKWPHISPKWRPNLWDTSLKVPLLIKWPGVVKENSTNTKTVDFTDFFPSICRWAGVALPKTFVQRGQDITPLLIGQEVDWNNEMYSEYDQNHGDTEAWMRSYRTAEWKVMIDFRNSGRGDLYDLKKDPDEKNNLYHSKNSKHQKIINDYREIIIKKMKDLKDPKLQSINVGNAPETQK